MNAFGDALNGAGDANLIDHFGELARTGRSHEADHLGEAVDDGFRGFEGIGIAADHHTELSVFSAGLSAGYRSVETATVFLLRCFVQFTCDRRGRCRVVDVDGACLHAGERAVRAECDGSKVVVVADAREDEVRALGRGLRRRCGLPTVLGDPLFGFRSRAIEDRYLMIAALRQMARHRITHHTQTDKCDLCHRG